MVRAHAPGARVVEIPHLFEPPALPAAAEVLRYRQRLGIAPGAFVFGVFGYLRESKRADGGAAGLRAAAAHAAAPSLLVAGDFVSTDLARAAAPLLASARHRAGAVPGGARNSSWRLGPADACINLR